MLNLAKQGLWYGGPYTVRHIYRLRKRVGMERHLRNRPAQLRTQGYVTTGELASQLGLCRSGVRKLGRQGRILCEQIKPGKRFSAMYKFPASPSLPAFETRRRAGDTRQFERGA